MRRQKGLTLIELLAVIAIIAILFILLIPQVTKATDKARVSGVQVDLHSYEVGMRSYFMEHFGEVKTVEKLNTYLDKSMQFELKDGKYVSKIEQNPYKVNYELTSDWQTYMQVNSYTDEKDPRVHAVRVYEEGNEVKSIYIGFDDEKRKSEIDTTPPVIKIDPNGGENVERVFVEVTDDNQLFSIQYVWTKEKKLPEKPNWQSIENNTELSTVFLGKGTYHLHIKASDMDTNVTQVSSEAFILGDAVEPVITVTVNGSDEEKIKHTTVVSATDNKGIAKIEYAWSSSDIEGQVDTDWKVIETGTTVSTPDLTGGLYLHVKATDISDNVSYFITKMFNTGDTQKPGISLSVKGSNTEKDSHTTVVTVTDNDQVHSVKYVWSASEQRPTEGWATTSSGSTLTTPTVNANLYLYIEAKDRSGNTQHYRSDIFKTGDQIKPLISLSPNGKDTVAVTHSTIITATDNKGIKKVEFVWSESETFPTTGWTVTASGRTLTSKPTNGNVYLYARAEDKYGNVTEFKSNAFVQSPFVYTVTATGTKITDYKGTDKDVVIPSILGGQPVTRIGMDAFSRKGLTSVKLPDTLITIDSFAFSNNQLTEIIFPEGLVTIGDSSFKSNKIERIETPSTVTSIGGYAFANNSLKEVILNEGLLSISAEAFYTNALTSIKFPVSLTHIGNKAFYGNANLKTVVLCTNLSTYSRFSSNPTITQEGC